jgi:pSer/pThr/pTyr-binding forkhead associated (FHA) protein
MGLLNVSGDLPPLALVHVRHETNHIAFRLREGTITVGRSTECEIILTSDSVSRTHAKLIVSGDEVRILDLNSRNGTYINDQLVVEGHVRLGDRVKFGGIGFLLQHVDGILEGEEDEETMKVPENVGETAVHSREELTQAQRRVYDLLLKGKSEKELAKELHLSPNTVHSHVQAIYAAFGVNSRAKLIAQALRDQ